MNVPQPGHVRAKITVGRTVQAIETINLKNSVLASIVGVAVSRWSATGRFDINRTGNAQG